jgi:mRNA deadenylase 3'-5' endonuclease subunit Ccr4
MRFVIESFNVHLQTIKLFKVFEMTHLLTYHNTLARRYMRLSTTIEVETALAQHNRRKVRYS